MPVSKTPIGDQLAALYPDRSGSRRARFKAAALADRLGTRTFQVAGCVGGRTVTVSDIHVDGYGTLVCTITHRDIPAGANPFRFVNPPVCVRDADDAVVEDLSGAFAEMVADVVKSVVG